MRPAAESDARRFVLDLGVELFLDGEQEVAAVAFELKREQVVGQQARQDLAAATDRCAGDRDRATECARTAPCAPAAGARARRGATSARW